MNVNALSATTTKQNTVFFKDVKYGSSTESISKKANPVLRQGISLLFKGNRNPCFL